MQLLPVERNCSLTHAPQRRYRLKTDRNYHTITKNTNEGSSWYLPRNHRHNIIFTSLHFTHAPTNPPRCAHESLAHQHPSLVRSHSLPYGQLSLDTSHTHMPDSSCSSRLDADSVNSRVALCSTPRPPRRARSEAPLPLSAVPCTTPRERLKQLNTNQPSGSTPNTSQSPLQDSSPHPPNQTSTQTLSLMKKMALKVHSSKPTTD